MTTLYITIAFIVGLILGFLSGVRWARPENDGVLRGDDARRFEERMQEVNAGLHREIPDGINFKDLTFDNSGTKYGHLWIRKQ